MVKRKEFLPNFSFSSLLQAWKPLNHGSRRRLVKKYKRKFKRQNEAFSREYELHRLRKTSKYKKERKLLKRKKRNDDELERKVNEKDKEQWLKSELKFRMKLEQQLMRKREQEDKATKRKALQKETEDRVLDELAWKAATVQQCPTVESNAWHNPFLPEEVDSPVECPYFRHVGSCRFGFKCRLVHTVPTTSKILLFPNMFRCFSLIPPPMRLNREFDDEIDSWLESDENELMESFREFLTDVRNELETFGRIMQIFVCRNQAVHLCGNVYVEYELQDSAISAYDSLRGRFYDGKQLWPQFCNVRSWRGAICDAFMKNRCEKKRNCNFLHIFDPS